MAKKSIRVLILATTDEIVTEESLPSDYTLVGILAIRDDVRPEAVEAIHDVQQAVFKLL